MRRHLLGYEMSELDTIKKSILISSVIGRDQILKQDGIHHVGLCPFHHDTKAGNFKVTDSTYIYHCFSCKAGGDVFDYLQKIKNMDFKQAKEYLGHADIARPTSLAVKSSGEWIPIIPVPTGAGRPDFKHYIHGEPITVYRYADTENRLLGYTCRLESDGKKQVLPFTYCQHSETNKTQWMYKGFSKPRPIYQLNSAASENNILIVEGEKCADAAQTLLTDYAVVSWVGGSGGVDHTDWSALAGKNIIIWPDNDEPGYTAAQNILKFLPQAEILAIPDNYAKGWDVADAIADGWSCETVTNFIQSTPRIATQSAVISSEHDYEDYDNRDYSTPELVKQVAKPQQPTPMLPSDYEPSEPFRHLGYNEGNYYFFSNERLQVVSRSASALSVTANLMELAPLDFWQDQVEGAGIKGEVLAMLVRSLISKSTEHGIYNPDRIRGRGAWTEEKNIIVHTGTRLIVNGESIQIADYRSNFIYPAAQKIRFTVDNPLSNSEAFKFMEICQSLNWEKPIYATFLAGWAVVAPVCGALDWRPHIWLTAKSGAGKSYVQSNILRPMISDFGIIVQGRTSEAGIRQTLGNDALPVLFDEAESENERAGSMIENILALIRQASSESGGKIIKGTAGGKSLSFSVRSCFALSSISVPLTHLSDTSRISVLSLIQDGSNEAQDRFAELQQRVYDTITPEYAHAMQARTVQHLHTLKANAHVFGDAAAKFLKNKRLGDQMGILIAGAYLLYSTKLVTEEIALDWISKQDWSEQQVIKEESDENKLMFQILNANIRVNTPKGYFVNRSVAELVNISRGYEKSDQDGVTYDSASNELLRLGLKVEPFHVIISNNHDGIKGILRNTAWATNHARTLGRITGAQPTDPIRFKSALTRAVSVPYGS